MNWQEFFAMGGHAFYVWTSFGATAVVMLANWLLPLFANRKLISDIRRQLEREAGDKA